MHDLLLSLTYHGKLLKFQMFSVKTRNIIKLPNLKACGGTTFSIKDSAVSRKKAGNHFPNFRKDFRKTRWN